VVAAPNKTCKERFYSYHYRDRLETNNFLFFQRAMRYIKHVAIMKPFRFRASYHTCAIIARFCRSPLLGIDLRKHELNCYLRLDENTHASRARVARKCWIRGSTSVVSLECRFGAILQSSIQPTLLWKTQVHQPRNLEILPDSDHVASPRKRKMSFVYEREKGTRTLWTLTHSCLFVSEMSTLMASIGHGTEFCYLCLH
jgi:hypothetical protein